MSNCATRSEKRRDVAKDVVVQRTEFADHTKKTGTFAEAGWKVKATGAVCRIVIRVCVPTVFETDSGRKATFVGEDALFEQEIRGECAGAQRST